MLSGKRPDGSEVMPEDPAYEIKRLSPEDTGSEIDGGIVTAVKLIFERGDFHIFACRGGFSVKGNYSGSILAGLSYKVTGRVVSYNGQPQIDASKIEASDTGNDDTAAVAGFFEDNFEKTGPAVALRIAEACGENALDEILERPSDAASKIEGLTEKKAVSISQKIEEDPEYYRTILKLRIMGLGNARAVRVYKSFGAECTGKITDNPYVLMKIDGIGFETCELIARKLQKEKLSINRFEGAAVSAVEGLHEASGSTFLSPDEVRRQTYALLSADTEEQIPEQTFDGLYSDALDRAVKDKFIVIFHFKDGKCIGCKESDEGARIASHKHFVTELYIKEQIEAFIDAKKVIPDKDKTMGKIRVMGQARGLELDALQEEAVYLCMYSPLAIITGGPGTGKTTIMSILARHFAREKIDVRFCAPTGRAAKRLSEAAGTDASTVHRLLEASAPSDDEEENNGTFFGRNRSNPLECRVVVVDEASMIDIFLFKALLDAMRPGASLILVGDPEQLPSVGPGNLLSDLISCDLVPCVRLNYVFRQAEESSIASNAVRILNGEYPVPGDDFEIIKTRTDAQAAPIVEELSVSRKDSDFVILSPTRQRLLGTAALNQRLQERHNEGDGEAAQIRADLKFYPGDKVMQIKNDYSIEYYDSSSGGIERGVFNGQMGRFEGFDVLTGKYNVLFDDEDLIGYDKKNISDIELAYAVTVHKAQGCEFDEVAVVLGGMDHRLSNRKLLYTAVTRGRNKVTVIDSGDRLSKMLGSRDTSVRNTSLPDFLSLVASRRRK